MCAYLYAIWCECDVCHKRIPTVSILSKIGTTKSILRKSKHVAAYSSLCTPDTTLWLNVWWYVQWHHLCVYFFVVIFICPSSNFICFCMVFGCYHVSISSLLLSFNRSVYFLLNFALFRLEFFCENDCCGNFWNVTLKYEMIPIIGTRSPAECTCVGSCAFEWFLASLYGNVNVWGFPEESQLEFYWWCLLWKRFRQFRSSFGCRFVQSEYFSRVFGSVSSSIDIYRQYSSRSHDRNHANVDFLLF